MAKTIMVEIACAACGSSFFAFHSPPAAKDLVSCAECGELIGSYSAIRERAKRVCEEHKSLANCGGPAGR